MNKPYFEKLKIIPNKPGCYLWKNINDEVIYVGKAKNLYKRTHQYFLPTQNSKTISLVNEIYDIDFFCVNNENESLILENNLIKQYMPKYNILLKDQSEYPYIVITDEKDPRIVYTRKINSFSGKHYGPLAHSAFLKFKLFTLLNQIIPFRKCKKVPKTKCIYFDIGQCLGPCINKIDPKQYQVWKKYIDELFKNKNKNIFDILKQKELNAAELLLFEQAQKYKEIASNLKELEIMQIMEITNNQKNDYIAYYINNFQISIIIFKYIDNKLLSKNNVILDIIENENQTIIEFINSYYSVNIVPNNIIINLDNEYLEQLNIKYKKNIFLKPNTKQKDILRLAALNAKEYYNNNFLIQNKKNNFIEKNINYLKSITGLKQIKIIELYDNSNIQLENPISGMIVYYNGILNKQMSRKYKLFHTSNDSDYEFMKQVIEKRYKNKSNQDILTDLIIVDGGKIQVNAANEVLRNLNLNICVIGLKKNNNHKTESIILSNLQEIKLDKKSDEYLFLSKMQDDVHNFSINFFRQQKINNDFISILNSIPGLGKQGIKKLYSVFKDINEIKNASLQELEQILNKKVALKIKEILK